MLKDGGIRRLLGINSIHVSIFMEKREIYIGNPHNNNKNTNQNFLKIKSCKPLLQRNEE